MGSKNAYIVAAAFIFVILIWAVLAIVTINPQALVPSSEIITVIDWILVIKVIIPIVIAVAIISHYRRREK